jgi:hypothetical protein
LRGLVGRTCKGLEDKRTGELKDKRARLEDKRTGELEDKRTRLEDKRTWNLRTKEPEDCMK